MALSLPGSRGESQKRESEKLSEHAWPDWKQQTVVIMASGPSLTADDVRLVKAQRDFGAMTVRCIAINDCGLARRLPLSAPWADILYAADARWWQFYKPAFTGLRISGENVPDVKGEDGQMVEVPTRPLEMITTGVGPMPRVPGKVVHGNHSGFQALGLALSLGASRVLLLGYDCGVTHNRRYAHKNREKQFCRESPYGKWPEPYNQVPVCFPNVEVINCAMESNLQVFPKRELREVL